MADASPQIRLPGRNALSGRPAITHANQDGGKPGLVIEELVHLGKLNIRGAADILPGITVCDCRHSSMRVQGHVCR